MTNQLHALIITDDNPLTMEIAGSPALKHWAELLKPYCNKISLGLKMGQNFNEGKNYTPEIKVIYNEMEELQALGMLHTAMKNNHQDSFMILAMDQIHLSKDLIEFLRKRRNSKKKITAFLGDYFFPFPAVIESSFYSAVKANTLNKKNDLSKFYYYNRDKTQILRWYDKKVFTRKR